jgi:tetratricopeptide (TPR) repeat protein
MSDTGTDPEDDHAHQIELLTRVVAADPNDAAAWYDLGLAHKYLRHWRESADANLRALELESEPGDPAWWNLGIAATALRDWELARRAWRGYGIDDPNLGEGSAPIELHWNINPVRIRSADGSAGEVVWGRRLCPARIKIESIPFPVSEHRWGDVVLHDGAPNGERTSGEITYPVFDEIERWSPSEIPTLRADVQCKREDDAVALLDAFRDALFEAEDWSTNVRRLCKACSEGRPESHEHSFPEGGEQRVFGIAAPPALALRVLASWRDASPTTRAYEEPQPVG